MLKNSTPFIDVLFILLLGFIILFSLSFLMIRPMIKKADARNNAEIMITMTWPDNSLDDVDLWVEDPLGGIVWYRQKEKNLTHLDRDDLGRLNDVITLADGTVVDNPRNQEIATIRGFLAGEWCVNIHMYKKRDERPTPVKVTVDRINPSFKTLFHKEIVLESAWQEETATRFNMLASGVIISWDDLPKNLVKFDAVNYQEDGEH